MRLTLLKPFTEFLGVFPHEHHELILTQLSESLLGILNQRLIETTQNNQTAVFEFMHVNHAIKNAVARGDIYQLNNTIATSIAEGMITFEKYLDKLISAGKISLQTKLQFLSRIQ